MQEAFVSEYLRNGDYGKMYLSGRDTIFKTFFSVK